MTYPPKDFYDEDRMTVGEFVRLTIIGAVAVALGLAVLVYHAEAADPRGWMSGPVTLDEIRVIDGDTVAGVAHPWPGVSVRTSVRLDGVDTPELRGRCPEEKELAGNAKMRLDELLRNAGTVGLRDVRHGKYAGRVVARVEASGVDVAETLIEEGLGRRYHGGKRRPWCPEDGS